MACVLSSLTLSEVVFLHFNNLASDVTREPLGGQTEASYQDTMPFFHNKQPGILYMHYHTDMIKYPRQHTSCGPLVAHRRQWLPPLGHQWPTHHIGGVLSGMTLPFLINQPVARTADNLHRIIMKDGILLVT